MVSTIIASFGAARSSTELSSGSSTELVPRSLVPSKFPVDSLATKASLEVFLSRVSSVSSLDWTSMFAARSSVEAS